MKMASKTYELKGTVRNEIVVKNHTVTVLTRGGTTKSITVDNTDPYTQQFINDPKYEES
jgi:hypothetical protein